MRRCPYQSGPNFCLNPPLIMYIGQNNSHFYDYIIIEINTNAALAAYYNAISKSVNWLNRIVILNFICCPFCRKYLINQKVRMMLVKNAIKEFRDKSLFINPLLEFIITSFRWHEMLLGVPYSRPKQEISIKRDRYLIKRRKCYLAATESTTFPNRILVYY